MQPFGQLRHLLAQDPFGRLRVHDTVCLCVSLVLAAGMLEVDRLQQWLEAAGLSTLLDSDRVRTSCRCVRCHPSPPRSLYCCGVLQLVHSRIGNAFPFVGRDNFAQDIFSTLRLQGRGCVRGGWVIPSLPPSPTRPPAGRAQAVLDGEKCTKHLCPVGVVAAGPGVGKSTLAERVGRSVSKHAATALADSNPAAAALFQRWYQLNLMFAYPRLVPEEKSQFAEESLAVRVLWQAFCRTKYLKITGFYKWLRRADAPAFDFDDVVECIARASSLPGSPSDPLFLVVVIDEAQTLVCRTGEDPSTRPQYVHAFLLAEVCVARHNADFVASQVAPGAVGRRVGWCPHKRFGGQGPGAASPAGVWN